ncbi:MAG: helix-turn-helix domain-containing protein, partial [Actinomycetota bacterium]
MPRELPLPLRQLPPVYRAGHASSPSPLEKSNRSRLARHARVVVVCAHSRFTLFFEAFAIEVLQACRTVKAAASLLGLSWDAAQTIMDRAVERG